VRQGTFERADRFLNELCPVVKRNDGKLAFHPVWQNLFGQAWINFCDFAFYIIDYFERIGAITRNYYPAYHFGATFVEQATTGCRSKAHLTYVFDSYRHIVLHGH